MTVVEMPLPPLPDPFASFVSEPYKEFAKISRLSRPCVVTEKIDGTNAQVHILDDGRIFAGSRNRYLFPVDKRNDNFGFGQWVHDNADELSKLGPGRHYGEWWGSGIQRTYGLKEKRFSLFNTARWVQSYAGSSRARAELVDKQEYAPECCHVVPVLYTGPFTTEAIDNVVAELARCGSLAALGFMNPEGVVVFHTAASVLFKKTVKNDESHKTLKEAA